LVNTIASYNALKNTTPRLKIGLRRVIKSLG